MKYIVELHITQIHDIEIQANGYEDARNKALEQYNKGLVQVNSIAVEESAKVVSFTSMPTIEEILGEEKWMNMK